MIGTETVSVDAPAGNVTDALKGAKIGLAAVEAPPLVAASAALNSMVTGAFSAEGVNPMPPCRGHFTRVRVTVNAPTCWFTFSLDSEMTRDVFGENTELALRGLRVASTSAWASELARDVCGEDTALAP